MSAALGTLHQVAATGKHKVPKDPLGEAFENIIVHHAPRGQGSEVAWALWGALAWSVPLSSQMARAVSEMNDDIVALLALDADARGLFSAGALDKNLWSKIVSEPNVLYTEHWLLAYEADRQTWLPCPSVASNPVFLAMKNAGVSFYDPSQNKPQIPAAAGRMPGGRLSSFYA
jgi:hypothetical protein